MSNYSFIGKPAYYILILLLVITVVSIFGCAYTVLSNPYTSGSGEVDADHVQNIKVQWECGNVLVQSGDTDSIIISETGAVKGEHQMIFRSHNGELTVRHCMPRAFHPISGEVPNKDLVITVPEDKADIYRVSIIGVETNFHLEDCNIRNLSVELGTRKSNFTFEGILDKLDFRAQDTSFTGTFYNTPQEFNISSTLKTGDAYFDFTLPHEAGYIYTAGHRVKNDHTVIGIYDEEKANDILVFGDKNTYSDFKIAEQYYYGDQSLNINIAKRSALTEMKIHAAPPVAA